MLATNQAQSATNCRLTSGYLEPFYQPKLVVSPGVAAIKAIFPVTDGVTVSWLAWNRDVDAAKGQIAGDSTYRTYFTGDGEPRVTDVSLATAGTPYPKNFYVLGVYPPVTAPSLTHAGGTGVAVSRAFVYTFVTPWGEESQNSLPSALVVGKVDGTWTIGATTGMDVAPLNSMSITGASWAGGIATVVVASTFGLRIGEEINVTGMNPAGYNGTKLAITALTATQVSYLLAVNPGAFVAGGTLARVAPHNTGGMTKRLYWLESLADGPHLRLVAEIAVATTNTTVAGNTISTAELVSQLWVMPPADMQGIVMMPNGITAGFHRNELVFSPPYIPYAYPLAYRLTTDFDIVAVKATGSMLVVGTKGVPVKVGGIDPANMSMEKCTHPWVCLSKRSMVVMPFGVMFAAPPGLVLIGLGGEDVITKDLFTQKEWKALKPETFNAGQYAGRYVASYTTAENIRQVLAIDKSEPASYSTFNVAANVFFGDETTGELYTVIADQIFRWDGDSGLFMIADWWSAERVFPKPVNLGAAKIDAKFTITPEQTVASQAAADAQKAVNAALIAALNTGSSLKAISLNAMSLGGSKLKKLPAVVAESVGFQIVIDGDAKFSKVVTNSRVFRLPSGYKADNAAIRLSSTNVQVKAVIVAETIKGLKIA